MLSHRAADNRQRNQHAEQPSATTPETDFLFYEISSNISGATKKFLLRHRPARASRRVKLIRCRCRPVQRKFLQDAFAKARNILGQSTGGKVNTKNVIKNLKIKRLKKEKLKNLPKKILKIKKLIKNQRKNPIKNLTNK